LSIYIKKSLEKKMINLFEKLGLTVERAQVLNVEFTKAKAALALMAQLDPVIMAEMHGALAEADSLGITNPQDEKGSAIFMYAYTQATIMPQAFKILMGLVEKECGKEKLEALKEEAKNLGSVEFIKQAKEGNKEIKKNLASNNTPEKKTPDDDWYNKLFGAN
jgi:hypothetical protein